MASGARTFFISYNQADKSWAEWIAWQLEALGHTCHIQAWDSRTGMNFVAWMNEASAGANHTIAVLSPDFFGSKATMAEWSAAFGRYLDGEASALLPVRVREPGAAWRGLLPVHVYTDLVGVDEEEARHRLHEMVRGLEQGRLKPDQEPAFPGASRPRTIGPAPAYPGRLPEIHHLPLPRNPDFTGRQGLLEALHDQLGQGGVAAVTQRAVHGLGGIGKSQLALEFCYRHGPEYTLLWWLRAESPATLTQDLLALGERLEITAGADLERVNQTLAALGQRTRWLLVYDNAPDAKSIHPFLPRGGAGAVIITSRNPEWRRVAAPIEVEVLPPDEAAALLLQAAGLGEEERAAAMALAKTLGCLPLALAQAGAYMADQGIGCAEYGALYQRHHLRLFNEQTKPVDYPQTVGTTWEIAFQSLDEAPRQLLNLLAFLDPDQIPLWIFIQGPEGWLMPEWDAMPEPLAAAAQDELAWGETVGALRRHGLVVREEEGLSLHRLVQAVTRARLGVETPAWATRAARLVRGVFRHDDADLATWPRCERVLPHALAVAEQARGVAEAQAMVVQLWGEAGNFLCLRARYPEAAVLNRQALELTETLHGPDHPDVALRANNLGSVLYDMDDLSGARALFERALGSAEAVHGPEHPDVALCANNLGAVLQAQGDLVGARALLERALRIDEVVHGPEHPNVAIRANNLGDVLRVQGDLPGAKALFERALRIDEAVHGPDHPLVAICANNLGSVLRAQGDLSGAKALFERALRIDEAIHGPDHPSVARDANNLGLVLWAQGDLSGARALYERALRILEKSLGPEHPSTRIARENLAFLGG